MTPQLERQIKVSKMLSLGFVFTIWPAAWMTSFIAVILGVRGMVIIERSEERMVGRVIAWWCIIVGSLETFAVFLMYIEVSLKWFLCARFQL
jgi:hypothetical protein